MLLLLGSPKKRAINKSLRTTHKVFGYFFVSLFCVMCIIMIQKAAAWQHEFSSRANLHIALSIALGVLLLLKICIARFFKKFVASFFAQGILIFVMAVVLTGLSAGYYFLHRSDIKYISLSDADAVILDETVGKTLVNTKCGKCHSLEKVYKNFKSESAWTKTVNRMAVLDEPNIRDFDAKQMIHFLVAFQEKRKNLYKMEDTSKSAIRRLVTAKCSVCHDLDQVYAAEKSVTEWEKTVKSMVKIYGDAEFISDEEKAMIAQFLAGESGK